MLAARREKNRGCWKWKNAEDVMEWWFRNREKTDSPIEGQIELDLNNE
jgi:hypothetical protein